MRGSRVKALKREMYRYCIATGFPPSTAYFRRIKRAWVRRTKLGIVNK